VDSGAVVPIPASYLSRVVGWDDGERTSEASRLADADQADSTILEALEGFTPFDDEDSVSECRYIFERANNYKHITVRRPLLDLNEDLMLATAVDAEILCPNPTMFSLMTAKLGREYDMPLHDIWASTVCSLPNTKSLGVVDIASMRANDELFTDWRSKLEDSLRKIRLEVEAGRGMAGLERAKLIQNDLSESAAVLSDRVGSSGMKKHFENAGVSFAVGATAAAFLSADPAVSIGTGAFSSVLRFVYDCIRRRPPRDHRLRSHLYTMFDISEG
jgi:hypothetical protein